MLRDYFDNMEHEEEYDNFHIFELSSKEDMDGFTDFLAQRIVESYRDIEFLKYHFKDTSKEDLRTYLENEVFPESEIQIDQNVKNGDCGEILAEQTIREYEDDMHVPIKKLKWKFNNKKSVFCTDIFAHNSNGEIEHLKYYEVKTYITRKANVGVLAFYALKNDCESGKDPIAGFLSQMSHGYALEASRSGNEERAAYHYKKSSDYMKIVKNDGDYQRTYEAVLVREKDKYREVELENIDGLDPFTDDLTVTVILVDNLQEIINESFEKSYDLAWNLVNG